MAELELLTYWTCYLYARATKSVSYATPTYYAHVREVHDFLSLLMLISVFTFSGRPVEDAACLKPERVLKSSSRSLSNTLPPTPRSFSFER